MTLHLKHNSDLLTARNLVRCVCKTVGLQPLETTKIITASSEICRNILRYAGEGRMLVEPIDAMGRNGVKVTCIDTGPGIPDVQLAMQNGFSTAGTLGLGLPGAKRLVNIFEISSELGKGTTVTMVIWKR